MTDLKLMESKEPTYEVVRVEAKAVLGDDLLVATYRAPDGESYISITDKAPRKAKEILLHGPEAIALSEFIAAHVRKRW